MTTQRKVASNKSANETQHQRAMTNPKVLELISNLKRDWAALDPLELGKRLLELTALDCSARGLAKALNQPATSIRRHMAIAKRPKMDRNAQAAAASSKDTLAQKASADRAKPKPQPVSRGQKTGALPEPPVLERALRTSESAAGELAPEKSLLEMYKDNMRRSAEIPSFEDRRKNEATRRFKRQGAPTPSAKLP